MSIDNTELENISITRKSLKDLGVEPYIQKLFTEFALKYKSVYDLGVAFNSTPNKEYALSVLIRELRRIEDDGGELTILRK